MTEIPEISAIMHQVLTEEADIAAKASGFIQRQRQITGAGFVQALVFGWLANPEATIEQLAQSAANSGMPISPQGLDQRFTQVAATCLQTVLAKAATKMVQADPVAIPILQKFTGGVFVLDSTTIVLPAELQAVWQGCGGSADSFSTTAAALKVQTLWSLSNGQLTHLSLNTGRSSDRNAAVQFLELPASSLRVADLGYFALERLKEMQARGNFVLSRMLTATAIFDERGKQWDLLDFIKAFAVGAPLDQRVEIGQDVRVPCRLLIVPVPLAVSEQRRRRLLAEGDRRKNKPTQRTLALCDWTILITTAPLTLLSLKEALVLLRARWQIELLFKLWKSTGQVDEWRSKQPWRILCEVYAKLLGMLVTHWIVLISMWKFPNRSLTKAAQSIQQYARSLARAVSKGIESLIEELAFLKVCLAKSCRMNKRKKNPNTYQLLLDIIA